MPWFAGAFALLCLAINPTEVESAAATRSVAQRRAELLKHAAGGRDAIPVLARGLEDDHVLVRRTAVRLLAKMGASAQPALTGALRDPDLLVRRTALRAVCDSLNAAALPYLAQAMKDENALVRHMALKELAAIKPRTERVSQLLNMARKDKSESIRRVAAQALWPFHKEVVSIRDRVDWDHDVKIAQTIPLPKDGWRFKLDPARDGHLAKCFEPGFDDSKWKLISIEQAWQKAGYDYIGVAWYRRTIRLPDEPKHIAVELRFKGVDECAWVWVNGQYVGQHDVGPQGWDQPFTLDVTREIKWGQDNQITVRAMNTAWAGGIWRPVQVEVLQ